MTNKSSDSLNFALAAIDPGTVTLGLSIGIINIDTELFVETHTRTINANILVRGKLIPITEATIEQRLAVIKQELLNSFNLINIYLLYSPILPPCKILYTV